jgi:hypothetical protein
LCYGCSRSILVASASLAVSSFSSVGLPVLASVLIAVGARLRLGKGEGGKELHERYLLTDIGCIKVGPGLDEGEAGEEFELVRLGQDLYRDVWTDYASEQPSYDCVKEIPIIRKAGPNR